MAAARRPAAVFTIVREEPVFLPIWLRYYSCHFSAEDIYVLHHTVPGGPEDRCCDGLACNVEQRPNALFDPVWLGRVVSEKQTELLSRYRAVLFAEVDEIVLPTEGTLRDTVEEFAQQDGGADGAAAAVACTGWELHHEFGREPPIDLSRPLLAQRGRWHRNTLYDKALLARAPLTYSLGFHTCEEPAARREGLLLLHLHKYDFQAYIARHEARAAMQHAPDAVANGWNTHYRATGSALMAQYLQTPAPLESIPEWLRSSRVV
eukprot:Transcript_16963.p2 GENE.Transcript_16963~~Transcript_16963.p2  ORF type:complete len:281 (+),score=114.44 Transcript_16963:55-843(+)